MFLATALHHPALHYGQCCRHYPMVKKEILEDASHPVIASSHTTKL